MIKTHTKKKLVRIAFTGGREYTDVVMFYKELSRICTERNLEPGDVMFIVGDARGLDRMARNCAINKKIPLIEFKADWDQYGKPAGVIRNGVMLKEGKPDFLIAFPGDVGTADMVKRAKKAGIYVEDACKPDGGLLKKLVLRRHPEYAKRVHKKHGATNVRKNK